MKPGNLFIKVLNPAATKDEDSIERTSDPSMCGFYFYQELPGALKKGLYYGKKTVYL